ncbi:MAG: GIY-YIG nuclease family protein [Patescibacteria group bacterium]
MSNLKPKLKKMPDVPGIYLFYDSANGLIYVGKATSLKSRVNSYFVGQRTSRPIEQLMHEVADIKYKITDSVLEAVILEAVYIKKFQPKYNVLGKDNKSWNYITISNDPYPVVETMRQHELEHRKTNNAVSKKDSDIGGDQRPKNRDFKYVFGPYPGLNTREALKILRRLFYFSTCQRSTIPKNVGIQRKNKSEAKKKPCFYYQLGQCLGVCVGEISPREYAKKVIRPLVLFLEGKKQLVIRRIETEMKRASREQNYEEAARLRNQARALNRIQDVALINKDFFSGIDSGLFHQSTLSGSEPVNLRIEGYDISNLGATGMVGSMVVFGADGPVKTQYRKFRIRSISGQSDVDCLEEVLRRRLKHSEWPLPDLILIDGGLPQINRAVKILRECQIAIPTVGIAKGPDRKKNEFVFGTKTREFIKWVNENQELLIRTRDEAHRFAISYQRQTRRIKY